MTIDPQQPDPQEVFDACVAALYDIVVNGTNTYDQMQAISQLSALHWGNEKVS